MFVAVIALEFWICLVKKSYIHDNLVDGLGVFLFYDHSSYPCLACYFCRGKQIFWHVFHVPHIVLMNNEPRFEGCLTNVHLFSLHICSMVVTLL